MANRNDKRDPPGASNPSGGMSVRGQKGGEKGGRRVSELVGQGRQAESGHGNDNR